MPNDPTNDKPDNTSTEEHRLPATVEPTKSLLDCQAWLEEIRRQAEIKPREHELNTGPYYLPDAPYRAKMSLPYENGTIVIIKGRVWSHEDKTPVEATMDVWQADQHGKYDNEESGQPTEKRVFRNRARVRCDEQGYYEIETIRPGPYSRGLTIHAAHIHFRVSFTGHVDCVTQLLFKGDSNIEKDPYHKYSEIIELTDVERNGQVYKVGIFNIVLKTSPDSSI
jgi:protocatechuate 3,4-dioxygenase beta subunit